MEDKKTFLVIIGIGVCVLIVVAAGFFWFLPSENTAAFQGIKEKKDNAGFSGHDPIEWIRKDGEFPGLEEKNEKDSDEFVVTSENLVYGINGDSVDPENKEDTEMLNEESTSSDVSQKEPVDSISVSNRIINNISSITQPNSDKESTDSYQASPKQTSVNKQPLVENQRINLQTKPQIAPQNTKSRQGEKNQTEATMPQSRVTIENNSVQSVKKVEVPATHKTVNSTPVQKQPRVEEPKLSTVTEYWIQTGSFSSLTKANEAKAKLQKKGAASTISTREINGEDYFRVRLGPYIDKNEAKKFLVWIKELEDFESSYISEIYIKK